MDLRVQRIIFVILMLLTFVIIFTFSNQSGEQSSSTSRGFITKIIEIFQLDKNLSQIEKEQLVENSQFIIRKLAHFVIYTIAGINIFGFINTYNIENKNKILYGLLIGISYAISDEVHQMFTDGRTASVRDISIDTCGILFGIIIFMFFYKIKNKKANNEK